MPTPEKVAVPPEAFLLTVPTVVALLSTPLTAMVTETLLLETVLPNASLMKMAGWVVNAMPLLLVAADVFMINWVAMP